MSDSAPSTTHTDPASPPSCADVAESLACAETVIAALRTDAHDRAAVARLREATGKTRADVKRIGCRPLFPLLASIAKIGDRLHDESIGFDRDTAEILALAFERVGLAVTAFCAGQELGSFQIDNASQSIVLFAGAAADDRAGQASRTIALLTGEGIWKEAELQNNLIADVVLDTLSAPLRADLAFFRNFGRAHEQRMPFADGRSGRLVRFAAQINAEAGTPIDPEQLEAAVYMHDLGMALLPESLLTKPGRLSDAERTLLRGHVDMGAGVLARIPVWSDAAKMVEQHHERPDGTGYPLGLPDGEIVPGAKLIAIVDAFEAMTHQRSDRQDRKSVLRAIAEINASEAQFSREWIPVANRVVRRLLSNEESAADPAA